MGYCKINKKHSAQPPHRRDKRSARGGEPRGDPEGGGSPPGGTAWEAAARWKRARPASHPFVSHWSIAAQNRRSIPRRGLGARGAADGNPSN